MGDDYEILVEDIFNELGETLIEPIKAARKIKRIQNMLAEWRKREIEFNKRL